MGPSLSSACSLECGGKPPHSKEQAEERLGPMGEETRAAGGAIEMVGREDRVLIVEDEDNARKGYEQLLQRWGCDVVGVATAEEALAKFASYHPETVIADGEI